MMMPAIIEASRSLNANPIATAMVPPRAMSASLENENMKLPASAMPKKKITRRKIALPCCNTRRRSTNWSPSLLKVRERNAAQTQVRSRMNPAGKRPPGWKNSKRLSVWPSIVVLRVVPKKREVGAA